MVMGAASWDVHITVEPEKNGEYMWKMGTPLNSPVVTVAKGGVRSSIAVTYPYVYLNAALRLQSRTLTTTME